MAVITVTAAMPVVNAKATAKIAAIFFMTFPLASQIDKLAWLQSALHCSFGCSAYTFVQGERTKPSQKAIRQED